MFKNCIKFLSIIILGIFLSLPCFAIEFDPNYIISDADFLDYMSMDVIDIQNFLEGKGGTLDNYLCPDTNGEIKSAAEIFYEAAITYEVNPKYLLTLMQREQSLITKTSPSERDYAWAMGYGICDSCDKDDPYLQIFKGFGNQVDRSAYRNKYYFENSEQFNHQPGKTYTIDGETVIPMNQATANLYNYTPHIHGNYNFWIIWQRWFAKEYPDGSLLQVEGEPGVWLIENGMRRAILTRDVLYSRFSESQIIIVNKSDLEKYEISAPLKFAQYSIVKDEKNNYYLIVNNEKKRFESEEVFKKFGYHPDEVINTSTSELNYYEDGRVITAALLYPTGTLVQNIENGGVFYVEDGIKYPIMSKHILQVNFPNRKMIYLDSAELDKYPKGQPIKFKEGMLIKNVNLPEVYVISNGQRRHIGNAKTFNSLGYKWTNIIVTNAASVNIHPLGEKIDLIDTTESVASN